MESLALNRLFGGVYSGTRVLVTGHTGFKGSWLCLWLQAMGAEVSGISLPPCTEPAHWQLLGLDEVSSRIVDLSDSSAVYDALQKLQPQLIFHLAAQSLVRRSYVEPVATFATNVAGLVNLFEATRGCNSVKAVVNVTTDKVYLEQPNEHGYSENHALGGHDPYSTSKACAELVTDCYRKSFFSRSDQHIRVSTARAGNVIGGGDWAEDRLVPDLVRAAVDGRSLVIRNPNSVRPWQHVLESLSGYLCLGQGLMSDEPLEGPWNFGPHADATLSVQEMVSRMQDLWPGLAVERSSGEHPHEAAILELDSRKSIKQLGWNPVWSAGTTIARTIDWYRGFYESGEIRSRANLADYIDDARRAGLAWSGAS